MATCKKEKQFKRVKNKPFENTKTTEQESSSDNANFLSVENFKRQTEFGYVIKELAELTGKSAEVIKNECCLFEIEKFLSGVSKVIVRQDVTDKKLEEILVLAKKLKLSEILISPAYLGAVRRVVNKNKFLDLKVNLLIDFPFGESSFKSKITEIKIGKSAGVDGVTVVLQSALLGEKNRKELFWQIKKFSKAFKENCSIAVSAQEITESQVKALLVATEKSKASSVTFMFGETFKQQVKEKIDWINKYKGKRPIKILISANTISGLKEILSLGADAVCTPYADEIAKELLKKFKISEDSIY